MPSLINEIQRLTHTTIEGLRALPAEVSDDPAASVLNLVMDFHRDVSVHVEGVPDSAGLIQQFRTANDKFRRSIRASTPRFRPYKRELDDEKAYTMPDVGFLAEEDESGPEGPGPRPNWDLYEEDVSKMSRE
jgi:hypothetical protein